ncbi:hypothetical protein [Shinella sp. M27]|uniref:hypothetical protein n=1 Tax=Shinella sp. M27 TaxID=3368614 RepID=UPI003B9E1F09
MAPTPRAKCQVPTSNSVSTAKQSVNIANLLMMAMRFLEGSAANALAAPTVSVLSAFSWKVAARTGFPLGKAEAGIPREVTMTPQTYPSVFPRPAFASQSVSIVTGLYLFLLTIRDFWPETLVRLGERPGTLALLTMGLACLFVGTCVIVSWKKMMMKPLLVVVVLLTAGAVWLLDQDSPFRALGGDIVSFATHMALFGLVPVALLLWIRVLHGSFFWQMRGNLAVAIPAIAIALSVMTTHLTDYVAIAGEEIAGVGDAGPAVTVHP